MALARVVTFENVNADFVDRIDGGERPEGVPATEIVALHDADAREAVVILFFDSEDDYAQGDAALNAMGPGDTPGRRTSVRKYRVGARTTA